MTAVRISSPGIQEFERRHIQTVRALAPECMVLLKNEAGILPVRKKGKLALYGNGARRTIKGGTGSGDVNVRHYVSVEEGLEEAGFIITSKAWLDAYDRAAEHAKRSYFRSLREEADCLGIDPILYAMGRSAPPPHYEFPLDAEGDIAVYVLSRISGEGADRLLEEGDLFLTQEEIRDIHCLQKRYEKCVLVLNTGGMVDLEPVKDIPAILLMGQLGTPSGSALADVLTGSRYPSGKLAMTWAPVKDWPSTEGFGDPNDTVYAEGTHVGYRYFNTFDKPVSYPFGYGLGYTTFAITKEAFTVSPDSAALTVCVTNTGTEKGREVVQVYSRIPDRAGQETAQILAAWAKTDELAPGETVRMELSVPLERIAQYSEEEQIRKVPAGRYMFYVGNSSREVKIAGELLLKEEKSYPAGSIETAGADTDRTDKQEIKEILSSMTEDQLIRLCIGAYKETDNILEIIGNASETVAGAAGETTADFRALGIPPLVFADGPAGLRLSPEYRMEGEKAIGYGSAGGDMLLVYTPEEREAMGDSTGAAMNTDAAGDSYYQYCTAIPVGTAVAQSWNEKLAGQLGDLVAEEMDLFGIDVWLAPALNIQRSPLCGRNYEYYSEDPLLSGKLAAAVTRGVQSHPGKAVCIKHFACNNQETNRFFSNSIVSETALREIYLRGFEICVKEAKPCFVMTSYNLLNGEHTCCSQKLIRDILRGEWGFQGVVMTDWFVTGGMGETGDKWPAASAAGNVRAGNDLTMPGMASDLEEIHKALADPEHSYALTREDLMGCAGRVLAMICKMSRPA